MRRRARLMVVVAFAGAAACNAVTGVHDLTYVDGVAGASSSGPGVGGGGGQGGVGGGDVPCGPVEAMLDAEGCPCAAEGDTRQCYLGDPGPKSACNIPGVQTCDEKGDALIWDECERASMPSEEVCFDDVDNDCDAQVDEQCPCSDSVDLCKDKDGMVLVGDIDHLLVVPDQVAKDEPFDLYLVSKLPLESAVLRINNVYCAGASGTSQCAAGSGCPGWSVIRQQVETTDPVFTGGYANLTMLINEANPSPPCDDDHERMVSAQVFILPTD